jgi:hypothetical protein
MVLHRVVRLRRTVQVNTNRLRGKSLKALEEMFNMAKDLAQNKDLKMPMRHKWAQVATYICQVINTVAIGFDEKEIDVQLSELEKLINEVKAKTKTGRIEKQVPRAKSAKNT